MGESGPDLSRWALLSIAAAVATIALKTVAWALTGSVGLLSDAAESVVNLVAAVITLVALRVAGRPPDRRHNFGHFKVEYFSAVIEGLMIAVAATVIIASAVERLLNPRELEHLGFGLLISVVAAGVNGVVGALLLRAARAHRSPALHADGKHLLTDVWTTAGVVVGLLLVDVTGWLWLDSVVALAVALNILREGGRLIGRSSQGLMDAALEPEVQARIDAVLERFTREHGGAAVVLFDHVLTRKAGQRRFVDLHMHLPPRWPLARADALRGQVEQALLAAVPGLHASIQMLPDGVEPISTD